MTDPSQAPSPVLTRNDRIRNFVLWVIIGLVLIALFNLFQNTGQHLPGVSVSYAQFQADVSSGKVRTAVITGVRISGTYADMTTFRTSVPIDAALVQSLQSKGIVVDAGTEPVPAPATNGGAPSNDKP